MGDTFLLKKNNIYLEAEIFEEKIKGIIASREGKPKSWSRSDFEIGRPLGSGQFGRVYLARDKTFHIHVALKTLNKEKLIEGRMQHQILREIEIHSHLHHPNILSIYTWFHDEVKIYLVLEYAAAGELFRILQKQPKNRFSDCKASKIIYQVADALEYCHSKKVIHRDIKPENLLVDCYGNVKLADFGWSVHAPGDRRETKCGTLDYLPPEMVRREFHNHFVDHWCLGILTYELLVGKPPFESEDFKKTERKIVTLDIQYPRWLSKSALDLISKLLVENPNERLPLAKVKKHRWIAENMDTDHVEGELNVTIS